MDPGCGQEARIACQVKDGFGMRLVVPFSEYKIGRASYDPGDGIRANITDGGHPGGNVVPTGAGRQRSDIGGDGRSRQVHMYIAHGDRGRISGKVSDRGGISLSGTFPEGIGKGTGCSQSSGCITARETLRWEPLWRCSTSRLGRTSVSRWV